MAKRLNMEFDLTTKIIVIILAVVVAYVISISVLSQIFFPEPSVSVGMSGMMRYFGNPYSNLATSVSLIPALIVGLVAALMIKTKHVKESEVNEYKVLKRALSEDERLMYEEVKRSGKITQDSLRFRLNWSKAKVSRILTTLDKMNLVQRERVGKTYNVFLQKGK